jgi:putative DNA primase/helicase
MTKRPTNDEPPKWAKDHPHAAAADDIDPEDITLTVEEAEKQFSAAMEAAGFGNHHIPADSEWHPFSFPDSSNGKQSGSAVLNCEPGKLQHGVVWDWRESDGENIVFRWPDDIRTTANDEVSAEKKAQQDEARKVAYELYASLPDADATHPYLVKHGLIHANYLKLDGDALVVPIYNCMTGAFQTIQRIWPNSEKRFPKHAVKKGGCCMPGSRGLEGFKRMHKRNRSPIVICEGYATADAVHMATVCHVLAALDKGNLSVVAKAMAKRYPAHPIIIAADNDAEEGRADNPGVESAYAAARAVGGKVAIPPPGDFCDLLMAKGEEAVRALIDGAAEPPPGRPDIEVKVGELSNIASIAEKALIDADVQFYERANNLVRPIVKKVDTFHGGTTTVAQLEPVIQAYMRDVLGRVADWHKFDSRSKKTPVKIDPPHDIAATILARKGEWKFPSLAGIITTPTMRPDGTILDQPGYDPATCLMLVNPPQMPPIPDAPTREQAKIALALYDELLVEFPFVDKVSRAVALSAFITAVVRGAFPVAPMHAMSAPDVGAGKSYILNLIAYILTGNPMPVITVGPSVEEMEKRLGSALLAGQSLITLDNVSGVLKSDNLGQIIEQPRPQVRILGRSEMPIIDTRSTSLFANGTGFTLGGDLWRRVLVARMDPKVDHPELREFKQNPVAMVMADRGAYIAAALIICRGYIAAGSPDRAMPQLASFGGWSDIVRSALMWMGEVDPVTSMMTSRADDPERVALRELLAAWSTVVGIGFAYRMTLKDAVALIGQTTSTTRPSQGGGYTVDVMKWPELNAAMRVALGPRQQVDVGSLGNWMRTNKGRRVDGVWFDNDANPKGGSLWWVERADGLEQAGTRLDPDGMDAEPPP